jgi:uncharacterized RDD family membrane protein YckC
VATTPDRAAGALAPRADDITLPATAVRNASAAATTRYSGLVTRAIAAAIDALIIDLAALFVAAVVALILSIFPVTHDTKTLLAVIGGGVYLAWAVGYFVTFWSTAGQTPGDRVMRIRVVREDGTLLRPARAGLRLAAAIAGLVLLLGYIPILVSIRRRAFHDWVGGTVVVIEPVATRGTPP